MLSFTSTSTVRNGPGLLSCRLEQQHSAGVRLADKGERVG